MGRTDGARTLIGVAGGSGSGKSTLVRRLAEAVGEDRMLVLRHDAYYRDRSHLPPAERADVNYDHPDALETELLLDHLDALRAGRPVELPAYDFAAHVRAAHLTRVEPRPIVVLDGILVLADPRIRQRLDLALFVDTPADIRLARRLRRDTTERGRSAESVSRQYDTSVAPMHDQFVEPSRVHADLVIPGVGDDPETMDRVLMTVARLMGW